MKATMKAMVIPYSGGAFQLVERAIPDAGPGQIRLRVEACGVCAGENVAIYGHWPGGVQYPRVPGHEIIGVVDQLGAGVTRWKLGQRLGVGWSAGSDGVTGLTVDGGYAEYAVASEAAAVSIPDGLSAVDAAPLMCAGVTTYTALKHSVARMGDVVAIQGIGGLGHLAIQFAARAGFRTVAISRGADKKALALELGAQHYIDSAAESVSEALNALGGAKVVIATAPNGEAISEAAKGLAYGGEVVVVAGSSDRLDITPIQLLFRRAVRGWVGEGPKDIEETVRYSVLTHSLPRVETFPLEQANEAYQRMMKAEVRFRAVLTM